MRKYKPVTLDGISCEFTYGCGGNDYAIHRVNGRNLCAYHSPYDVDAVTLHEVLTDDGPCEGLMKVRLNGSAYGFLVQDDDDLQWYWTRDGVRRSFSSAEEARAHIESNL